MKTNDELQVLLRKMSFRPGKSGLKSDEWEVPFKALMFENSLGSGAFGKVVRSTINVAAVPTPAGNENSPARNLQPDTTVAVKLLHGKYGLRLIYNYCSQHDCFFMFVKLFIWSKSG